MTAGLVLHVVEQSTAQQAQRNAARTKPTRLACVCKDRPAFPVQCHHFHSLSSKRHKGREAESSPTPGLPIFSATGKGGVWETSLVSLQNSSLSAKVVPLKPLSPHLHSSENTYCLVIPMY